MGRSALVRWLSGVLGLALVVAAAPLRHDHRADGPVVHDDACVLAELAVEEPDIGLPSGADFVAFLAHARDMLLPASATVTDAARLASTSRDPPVAA